MTQVVDRAKWTPERAEIILAILSAGGSSYKAAKAAGIARSTAYKWRDDYPEFKERWDEAIESGSDTMEDESVRRAVEGVSKPVFYQGHECGYVQEYSDTLLMFQLKARRREKYSDKADLNVSGNVNVIIRRFTEIEGVVEEAKLIGDGNEG